MLSFSVQDYLLLMERDSIAYTCFMHFNLDIFSAAAEYFSISEHLGNEEGISEHLQCVWPEFSMWETKTNHSQTDRPTYSNFAEHAIVIHCVSVLCAPSTCTIKKSQVQLASALLGQAKSLFWTFLLITQVSSSARASIIFGKGYCPDCA